MYIRGFSVIQMRSISIHPRPRDRLMHRPRRRHHQVPVQEPNARLPPIVHPHVRLHRRLDQVDQLVRLRILVPLLIPAPLVLVAEEDRRVAAAASALRDLRLLAARRRRASALRQGRARRHPSRCRASPRTGCRAWPRPRYRTSRRSRRASVPRRRRTDRGGLAYSPDDHPQQE